MSRCFRIVPLLICAQLVISMPAKAAPIHEAAIGGDLEQLKQLLDEGADINAPDPAGTPLQWALFVGDMNVVRLLLERGANPNVTGASGTPLSVAVVVGNIEMVELLLTFGAAPDLGERTTPLIEAARKGSIEITELLLAKGADPAVTTFEGITALHEAAKRGHLEIAQRLVKAGADVNAISAAGRPPIHLAILGKHAAMTDYLRQQGAAPGEVSPITGLLTGANLKRGGEAAKNSCGNCHSFSDGKNIYGPHLWDVLGRQKGGVAGFGYSPALASLEGVWTFEDLNAFLARPAEIVPGTKMELIGISDPQTRADIIAYLRSLSEAPVPLP